MLDPSQEPTSAAVDWQVPQRLRSVGKAPSVGRLEPGDILLFEAIDPDFMQRRITALQRQSLGAAHAAFTHVGIVIDRNRFVEAELGGVQVSSLFDRCLDNRIKVRRAMDLDGATRTRVALFAMCNLRQPYDMLYAVRAGLRDAWRRWFRLHSSRKAHRKAVICSQLFADAFVEATGRIAVPNSIQHILPGDLSHSPFFEDVKMEWHPLV